MKIIKGRLEFFSEMGITAAVVRDFSSKGGFDNVLAIKEGDKLIVKEGDRVVYETDAVVTNWTLMKKHYSAVIIPANLEFEEWMNFLRKGYHAELHKANSSNY